MSDFESLGVGPWVVSACKTMSIYTPTEVQERTIPLILSGKSICASSRTGSGKTACFCLPILQKLAEDPYGVYALVLTPVRELATQIADQFEAFGRPIDVSVMTAFGGRSLVGQSGMLSQRPHVVIATPGRLAELLRSNVDLGKVFRRVKTLVLDEADRLLLSGFETDLAEIFSYLPARTQRQTLLFSATITPSVEGLLQKFGDEMITVRVTESIPPTLNHNYTFLPSAAKMAYLCYLLTEKFAKEQIIIFCSSIRSCQLLASTLEILGREEEISMSISFLHSLVPSQARRSAAVGKFKNGKSRILVATDVAARGLDIPSVGLVVHFELPRDSADYVHRAGRTARAGKGGCSLALVSESEIQLLKNIETDKNPIFTEFESFASNSTAEKSVSKLLGKISRARQQADVLLSEIGFDEELKIRKKRKTLQNVSH